MACLRTHKLFWVLTFLLLLSKLFIESITHVIQNLNFRGNRRSQARIWENMVTLYSWPGISPSTTAFVSDPETWIAIFFRSERSNEKIFFKCIIRFIESKGDREKAPENLLVHQHPYWAGFTYTCPLLWLLYILSFQIYKFFKDFFAKWAVFCWIVTYSLNNLRS